MQKVLSILGLIVVTFLLFWTHNFSCTELKEDLKNIPCLASILSVYGAILFYGFIYKNKEEDNINQDADISKINENIALPKKESSSALKEIEGFSNPNESGFLKIYEYIEKRQYELAIPDIYEEIRKNKGKKQAEFILRYLLYIAYSCFEEGVSKKDIEENLLLFIPLAKEYAFNDPYLYMEVASDLISIYVEQEKFDDIKKIIHPIIIEINNNYKVPSKIKLKYYSFQAMIYVQENNIPYAMGYFEKASKYDESSDSFFNMAVVYYYAENNIEKCLKCIEKIDVSSIEDYKFKVIVRMKYYCLALQKKYKDAYEIICNYSFSEKECSSTIKAHKAYLAYKTGNLKEAKTLSDDILKDEFETTALNVRAILQLENGEYELCIKNFDKIMPDFNKTKGERFYLGEIYYHKSFANLKLKNIKEAKEDFENAKNCGFFDFDPEYIVDLDIAYQEFLNNQNK